MLPWRSQLLHKKTQKSAFLLVCLRSLSTLTNLEQNSTPSVAALNIAIISGSTRKQGPPLPILGNRVNKHFKSILSERGHKVFIIDPNNHDEGMNLPLLEKPHFAYSKSQVPEEMENIHNKLKNADCYVAITPEYNHAPSPGLLNILNHFGSSTFSFKPSAIVSYSAGQWGGTRAAHSLRPVLSELGCLPVSAMVHIPNAADVLDEEGKFKISGTLQNSKEDKELKWTNYVLRCVSQLEWWADAAKEQRTRIDPTIKSPPLAKNPKERNAL